MPHCHTVTLPSTCSYHPYPPSISHIWPPIQLSPHSDWEEKLSESLTHTFTSESSEAAYGEIKALLASLGDPFTRIVTPQVRGPSLPWYPYHIYDVGVLTLWHTYSYSYVLIHIYSCSYIFVHTHTCSYILLHTHAYSCILMHTHAYSYVLIHTHTYIHTYTYSCIHAWHIRTYT